MVNSFYADLSPILETHLGFNTISHEFLFDFIGCATSLE